MRILHINGYQSPGRRFHGLAIAPLLVERGIQSHHLVWEHDKKEDRVSSINHGWTRRLTKAVTSIERRLSIQSLLYPTARMITRLDEFREADVLHCHIIHSGYLSIHSLPWLSQLKPLIWTLHDPWALTGHCIYPGDCQRWKTGCGECPSLDSPLPLKADRTAYLFSQKKKAYAMLSADIVVASEWMLAKVRSSPLFRSPRLRIHHIPFGIDLDRFSPLGSLEARKQFDIPPHHVVLMFRAEGAFKGVPYILKALESLRTDQPITLLTVGIKGVLGSFADRFGVVELGWTNDEDLLVSAFKACDVFLMPSTAEAFGVMAIEAMACGKPVVCFAGTSLPEIIDAPRGGISVPMKDSAALSQAIADMVSSSEHRRRCGIAARRRAESMFSLPTHIERISELYHEVATRCA